MTLYNGFLLIMPDKQKETSEGGIVIPEVAKEKPKSGTLISHNLTEKQLEGAPCPKQGSKIHYLSYSATEFEYLGQQHHLVKFSEIVGSE